MNKLKLGIATALASVGTFLASIAHGADFDATDTLTALSTFTTGVTTPVRTYIGIALGIMAFVIAVVIGVRLIAKKIRGAGRV